MRLQYALDMPYLRDGLELAQVAVEGGIDCVEAGHVMVKAEGVAVVRTLRERFPDAELVCDMKTMDTGAEEVAIGLDAGADIVIVCAAAPDGTIVAALGEARRRNKDVMESLMGVRDRVARAQEVRELGADWIIAHRGLDDTFDWSDPAHFRDLCALLDLDGLRVAVGGAVTLEAIPRYVELGVHTAIFGRALTAAPDPRAAAAALVEAAHEPVPAKPTA